MTKILLAGATGLIGSKVLKLLLENESVTQVVAPTRRQLPLHGKLINPIVESDSLPLDASWWAVDAVICALGTTRAQAGSAAAFRAIDYDYSLAIATQARRAGATRFALTSSVGANARSRLLYLQTKGALEDAVRGLGYASLTIVRPGFLGGDRNDRRPMERIVGTLLHLIAPILPKSARISPASTVAAILVDSVMAGIEGTRIVTPADIAIADAQGKAETAAMPA
ncbi:NAD(P)H-binding protein [Sphingomonas sp. 4RDLI-65]|uniref:NAD(P)H-binding protein n=1 Tax=Sphingomonas sp. 4RDLI-65 TaxID=3111641 RepID=UPI003C226920